MVMKKKERVTKNNRRGTRTKIPRDDISLQETIKSEGGEKERGWRANTPCGRTGKRCFQSTCGGLEKDESMECRTNATATTMQATKRKAAKKTKTGSQKRLEEFSNQANQQSSLPKKKGE